MQPWDREGMECVRAVMLQQTSTWGKNTQLKGTNSNSSEQFKVIQYLNPNLRCFDMFFAWVAWTNINSAVHLGQTVFWLWLTIIEAQTGCLRTSACVSSVDVMAWQAPVKSELTFVLFNTVMGTCMVSQKWWCIVFGNEDICQAVWCHPVLYYITLTMGWGIGDAPYGFFQPIPDDYCLLQPLATGSTSLFASYLQN